MKLEAFKQRFDAHLKQVIEEKIAFGKVVVAHKKISSLLDHAQALALGGGKRLRPYLAHLMYLTMGGDSDDPAVWRAIVGVELFHLFALIHDDSIDRASERHGVPTSQNFIVQHLMLDRQSNPSHYAESLTMLLGDLVYNWSYETLLDYAPGAFEEVRGIFSEMVSEVILGQMLDVDIGATARVTEVMLERKNELKTARYSFVQPMRLGAAMAGNLKQGEQLAREVGYALGMAFQIQDDLLDIVADPVDLGKEIFNDLKQGQHTFFTQYIFDNGTVAEVSVLKRFFGCLVPLGSEDEVLELFEHSGALDYGRELIRCYFSRAERMIKRSDIPEDCKEDWVDLVDLLAKRTC